MNLTPLATHPMSLSFRLNTLFKAIMTREKSDQLLLIFSCFFIVLIHSQFNPLWVSLSSMAFICWRFILVYLGKPLPHKMILLAATLACMAGIYWQFKTFLGKEAGVCMLSFLLASKMLEMHAKRDLFVIIYLSFFLTLTLFFQSQSFANAGLVIIACILSLSSLLSFQFQEHNLSFRKRISFILKMLGMTLPITIFCFLFLPRLNGPLWQLPNDASSAKTGLSESMAPGNISKLAQSNALVFRVNFINSTPDKNQMYWPAYVLTDFNGREWNESKNFLHANLPETLSLNQKTRQLLIQEITLEPRQSKKLFAIDRVVDTRRIENDPTLKNYDWIFSANGTITSDEPLQERVRYTVASALQVRHEIYIPKVELINYLALPPNFNPESLKLAQKIRSQYATDLERSNAVLRFFRQEPFFYTLEPPILGKNSVDDFLFRTRAGFCEHYASSFVVLMRAMNIPARVITGFQGGTINTVDDYYEVRESDAHAWAEIWLEGSGWLRVDPTAAVAPERILKNLDATQTTTSVLGTVANFVGDSGILQNLRMQISAWNHQWNQWVLNFDNQKQSQFLSKLGLTELNWEKMMLFFIIAACLFFAWLSLPLLKYRTPRSPLDKLYHQFQQKMAKQKLSAFIYEGPYAYYHRIEKQMPNASQLLQIKNFIEQYAQLKYAPLDTLDYAKQFQTLKIQLKKISL